ncbi:MAG: DUF5329 domain-containing protein [Bacteroidales bacterium]|nr:DUF5329 domain-containing protein [Bacteroidales bacterium]
MNKGLKIELNYVIAKLFFLAILLSYNIVIAQTTAKTLTEREKIEQLIASVEQLQDAKFIRNGTTYNAARAAEHLRTKLQKAGNRVKTAQDFIIGIASSSYFSGNPYYIKFKDGRQITSREFFEGKLREIEGNHYGKKSD